MKIPKPPPSIEKLLEEMRASNPSRLVHILTQIPSGVVTDPYDPWDKLRFKKPPGDLTPEEWWLAVKVSRQVMQRQLPLSDKNGIPFTYAVTDEVLRAIEDINRDASGSIGFSEQVTNSATRDRYIVNSLIEEAITSSQLEGAATTRRDAKEMIRSGRRPRTRDEQMIFNNYHAMRRIRELQHEPLTVDLILGIHRILTTDTLDNLDAAGRFQRPDEERVGVYSSDNYALHLPPAAEYLEERIQRICDFANRELDDAYVPPIVRAVIVHFALAYDHPFEDGNGRTARAVFYWSMLNQGYWLTEFISISSILKGAPGKYARSFLYTEQDDGDLTYFIIYHLSVIRRGVKDLHDYLDRKIAELKELQRSLAMMPGEFNYRQLALIENAIKTPGAHYSAISHGVSHNVARETARQDLLQLQERGLLQRRKLGKSYIWIPRPDMLSKLQP